MTSAGGDRVLAIMACTGLGLTNGLVHVVLRIPSFMATLGLWFVGLGIGTVALGGSAVRVLDHDIRSIAFERVLAFPLAVWIAAAMFLLALVSGAPDAVRTLHLRDRRRRGHCNSLRRSGQADAHSRLHAGGLFHGRRRRARGGATRSGQYDDRGRPSVHDRHRRCRRRHGAHWRMGRRRQFSGRRA